ncbi:hypothetical protein F5884DRAFT_750773 [Xylogone sp. PMI_703]|nr:hypothetical protein F5884DRAFT_750773 [Xylogone sp. PMI_703]
MTGSEKKILSVFLPERVRRRQLWFNRPSAPNHNDSLTVGCRIANLLYNMPGTPTLMLRPHMWANAYPSKRQLYCKLGFQYATSGVEERFESHLQSWINSATSTDGRPVNQLRDLNTRGVSVRLASTARKFIESGHHIQWFWRPDRGWRRNGDLDYPEHKTFHTLSRLIIQYISALILTHNIASYRDSQGELQQTDSSYSPNNDGGDNDLSQQLAIEPVAPEVLVHEDGVASSSQDGNSNLSTNSRLPMPQSPETNNHESSQLIIEISDDSDDDLTDYNPSKRPRVEQAVVKREPEGESQEVENMRRTSASLKFEPLVPTNYQDSNSQDEPLHNLETSLPEASTHISADGIADIVVGQSSSASEATQPHRDHNDDAANDPDYSRQLDSQAITHHPTDTTTSLGTCHGPSSQEVRPQSTQSLSREAAPPVPVEYPSNHAPPLSTTRPPPYQNVSSTSLPYHYHQEAPPSTTATQYAPLRAAPPVNYPPPQATPEQYIPLQYANSTAPRYPDGSPQDYITNSSYADSTTQRRKRSRRPRQQVSSTGENEVMPPSVSHVLGSQSATPLHAPPSLEPPPRTEPRFYSSHPNNPYQYNLTPSSNIAPTPAGQINGGSTTFIPWDAAQSTGSAHHYAESNFNASANQSTYLLDTTQRVLANSTYNAQSYGDQLAAGLVGYAQSASPSTQNQTAVQIQQTAESDSTSEQRPPMQPPRRDNASTHNAPSPPTEPRPKLPLTFWVVSPDQEDPTVVLEDMWDQKQAWNDTFAVFADSIAKKIKRDDFANIRFSLSVPQRTVKFTVSRGQEEIWIEGKKNMMDALTRAFLLTQANGLDKTATFKILIEPLFESVSRTPDMSANERMRSAIFSIFD